MQTKLNLWREVSDQVEDHIIKYVAKQYGPTVPDGWIEDVTAQECINHVKKYLSRSTTSVREGETKLDLLKSLHYLSYAILKLDGKL